MKKTLTVLTLLVFAFALACTAFAEGKTISPLPVLTDINRLTDRYVTTDIQFVEGRKVTLTLYEHERFAGEDIKALEVGDVIVTDGEEVKVETITVDADVWVNKGMNTELLLCENHFGEYERVMENDMVPWILLGSLDAELEDFILFLDWINPETGEDLEEPVSREIASLLADLQKTDTVGYDNKAVKIIYGNNNEPMTIFRYYSPAQ